MARSFSLSSAPLEGDFEAPVLVAFAPEGQTLSGSAAGVLARGPHDFAALSAAVGFSGREGHAIDLLVPGIRGLDRFVVLGTGPDANGAGLARWCQRGGATASRLAAMGITRAELVIDEDGATPEALAEFAAGLALRAYTFTRYRTARPDAPAEGLEVILRSRFGRDLQAAVDRRMAVAEGTMLARDLVNEPPNVLGPDAFADAARALESLGVSVEVLDENDMAALGMNALLAVGLGSARAPRLVVLRWQGGENDDAPLAFVGKGVVFDTGGISIKPSASMEDMKGDMGGAAAVLGLFHALARRKARVNAVGVLGIAENMPGSRAYRPGDILTTMAGKTVEVVNTDAEGRLVLADALWYTQDRFSPRLMVDLATLTGAMLVTLGHAMAGLFSNDETLVSQLRAAAEASGDAVWPMPMGPDFEKLIESRFADLKNSGGRKGGSITAAHFLRHFVNGVPWVHLDIAGTAFGAPNTETNTSWATGYGVALLDRFIADHHEPKTP